MSQSTLDLSPREIVAELDKFIVGQAAAKKAVAIALRNRWRRQRVEGPLREEITPKNIIMIGPTGVGKTEIARRLAKLAGAPFLKVEASKFTEVGYVGKDVESMVRDLAEAGVKLVEAEERERVQPEARRLAEERLLDVLLPKDEEEEPTEPQRTFTAGASGEHRSAEVVESGSSTREKLRKLLQTGKLDDRTVEIEVAVSPKAMTQVFTPQGMEEMGFDLSEIMGSLGSAFGGGKKTKRRSVAVPEALRLLTEQEAERLVDREVIQREAIRRVEQAGIIFLDEIDKIAGGGSVGGGGHGGPDVSREGVQRDILPIIEGSNVNTKHGMVRTDHVLFIAAGAFHVSKPSDLIPELQGRFPIRVELDSLSDGDFVRILTEPENALTRQYAALLETEGVGLEFTNDGIEKIADIAVKVNAGTANIGARRLHTILERLLEEISFSAPERRGERIVVDADYVTQCLQDIVQDEDLSRYIL